MNNKLFCLVAGLLVSGGAFAGPAGEPASPPPAYQALIGTDLETMVRLHSVLDNICDIHSLDEQITAKNMLLEIKLLDQQNALKDVHNSDEITWLMNAYYVAFADGMRPMLELLEKQHPGTKARLCNSALDKAQSLLSEK